MLYALYRPDGQIHQANKVYDPSPEYDQLLHEEGYNFIKVNAPGLLPPEEWFVDVTAKELMQRPLMPIEISKKVIKAGDSDSTILTGIPKGATFNVTANGSSIWSGKVDDGEMEVSMPVPCLFAVTIELWPYRLFSTIIEVR